MSTRPYLLALAGILFAAPSPATGPFRHETRDKIDEMNAALAGSLLDFTRNHRKDRRFYSEALGEKRDMYIYLPPGYDAKKRYPLMIFMHGFNQDEKDFLTAAPIFDAAIKKGELAPMVIAAPDGSTLGTPSIFNHGSFYLNSRAGKFEDYMMHDVYNFVVTNFSIRPEPGAHVLFGASMGGFGAFNLGIKYRHRFSVAAALFPPLNLRYEDCHGRYRAEFDPNCFQLKQRLKPLQPVAKYVGGLVTIRQLRLTCPLFGFDHDALVRVSQENPYEMLACYRVKPGELAMYVAYGRKDEFFVHPQCDSFIHEAERLGLTVDREVTPDGHHDVETGLKFFPKLVQWIDERVRPYSDD